MTPAAIRLRGVFALLFALCAVSAAATAADGDRVLWPESERAFVDDGPGWLLSDQERRALAAMDASERTAWIRAFLARDPVPETPENELEQGIERRRRLVLGELATFLDDRARLLFLHGEPVERLPILCDQTFEPLEIWWYGPRESSLGYVLYQPRQGQPYRLWLPLDSKRVLYGGEMERWLEEVAQITGGRRGPRFDRRLCRQTDVVDRVTGVDGLFGYRENRPTNDRVLAILAPPADLGAWARTAAATPLPEPPEALAVTAPPEVYFPEAKDQRLVARLVLRLPEPAALEVFRENERAEVRLKVDGVVERAGDLFEEFHVRYQVPVAGEPSGSLALLLDRLLRPDESFLVRLKIRDEIGGAEAHATLGFRVPGAPQLAVDLPADVTVARGVDVEPERVPGVDSLIIIPPETDVVLGLWRVETLMSGARIRKVVFLLDGKPQFTRSQPPFQTELRLAKYPTEHVVRVEGYDSSNQLVAFDEVILNQQRGQLEVRIIEPQRGDELGPSVRAKASIVIPEERKLEKVEFLVDDQVRATLARPPWEADIEVPAMAAQTDVHYLTVAAYLDDGTRAEDVQFLSSPEFVEEVQVDLVELYTTIEGNPPAELTKEEFSVFEDGRPQEIVKFELVRDLPITIGVSIDTSGSMIQSLGEAKRAAIDFLESMITPKDQAFAVSFSNHPVLLMTRTSDVGAVAAALGDLHAVGNTALYDSVVTSLYYFRGVRGRRALVLLSDGEDTASTIAFKDALDYARRSGVVIYTIGLNIGVTALGVRDKLNTLAAETGGRSFYISKALDLSGVYGTIEEELRSQYLIAYSSDAPHSSRGFRAVEVKTKGRWKARTISGYYP
ncbi:MAG TPA: VWA domain-containing protein [Thermoanaerobaculia bacterium]|nr:VWA domain-containing protein [Thermoanaerobaculia bacterium]